MERVASIVLACCCLTLLGCSEKETPPYNFISNFSDGKITPKEERGTPTGKPVLVLKAVEVGDQKRDAIVTLAGSRIEFEIKHIKSGSKLSFGVGMNTKIGDGAEGIIGIEQGGNTEIVFQKYLNPVDRMGDRKWFDETLDLSKFKGEKVRIVFESKPGPKGDAVGDWFNWSNPELKF